MSPDAMSWFISNVTVSSSPTYFILYQDPALTSMATFIYYGS